MELTRNVWNKGLQKARRQLLRECKILNSAKILQLQSISMRYTVNAMLIVRGPFSGLSFMRNSYCRLDFNCNTILTILKLTIRIQFVYITRYVRYWEVTCAYNNRVFIMPLVYDSEGKTSNAMNTRREKVVLTYSGVILTVNESVYLSTAFSDSCRRKRQ